jgi:hypothetical protein
MRAACSTSYRESSCPLGGDRKGVQAVSRAVSLRAYAADELENKQQYIRGVVSSLRECPPASGTKHVGGGSFYSVEMALRYS